MKLYTEEQVRKAYKDGNLDGFSNVSALDMCIDSLTPIELPSDEEMANASNHCKDGQVKVGFLRGVLWYQEQILNQNK